MANVIYLTPDMPVPDEHHVTVIVHRDHMTGAEKAYFFDSAKEDYGGSGPFDFLMNEAIARAVKFAADHNIAKVIVRSKRGSDRKINRCIKYLRYINLI